MLASCARKVVHVKFLWKILNKSPPEKLKEGEYCYDHKASAEFSGGDGFDCKVFISATSDVSSFEMVDAIRSFYRDMKDTEKEKSVGSRKLFCSQLRG